jgi:hypothetical protein
VFLTKIVDHGGCWGYMAQTLDQWRHPVASSDTPEVLHWAMHPALYRCIAMAIKIAIDSPAFVDSLLPTTVAK